MNTNALSANASSVIVAVDLSKSVFQLAVADAATGKVRQQHRLSRTQFERWFLNRDIALVVMEACGGVHHWARWLQSLGIAVKLLPPAYTRAYVRRNKTDAADALALLEALRCEDIIAVKIKSIEQQALQALHRTRSQWMSTRTQRINALRGFCREVGIALALGSHAGIKQVRSLLADPQSALPQMLRPAMSSMLQEIESLEQRIAQLERDLNGIARHSEPCKNWLSVPGIGLLTATALLGTTGGSASHLHDARRFASGLGITPREFSSGNTRHLGRISKQGDPYLRMLLTHGARAFLRAASLAQAAGKTLDSLQQWALQLLTRMHHNKAVCAVANKLARICFAVLRDGAPYRRNLPVAVTD